MSKMIVHWKFEDNKLTSNATDYMQKLIEVYKT